MAIYMRLLGAKELIMLTRESYALSEPIKDTVDVKHWLGYLTGDTQRAMICFRTLPHREIRLACLKTIKDGRGLHKLNDFCIDWTEMTIGDLAPHYDKEMVGRLLDLYIDAVGERAEYFAGLAPDSASAKSAEPAKSLAEKEPPTWESFKRLLLFVVATSQKWDYLLPAASKAVSKYVADFNDCYDDEWMAPVHVFLAVVLKRLQSPYAESDWTCALHILRLIAKLKDRRFLETLDTLISKHEQGKAGPEARYPKPFEVQLIKAGNLGVLREVRRLLNAGN